jgi:hypothetical protein
VLDEIFHVHQLIIIMKHLEIDGKFIRKSLTWSQVHIYLMRGLCTHHRITKIIHTQRQNSFENSNVACLLKAGVV